MVLCFLCPVLCAVLCFLCPVLCECVCFLLDMLAGVRRRWKGRER